jgi:ATP-dependent DNA helicase RecQ
LIRVNNNPVFLAAEVAPATLALGGHVMSLLDKCRRTARRTFGIERLRPEQESAMVAITKGHDTLVALPTGFGKSLIDQVPAMILERPTIVVSPLIASWRTRSAHSGAAAPCRVAPQPPACGRASRRA